MEAKLAEFSEDTDVTPAGIVAGHLEDEVREFSLDGRTTGLGTAALPGPVASPGGVMPANDGVWLDDGNVLTPVGPEAGEGGPEEAVCGGELRTGPVPGEDLDLMSESDVLEGEISAVSDRGAQSQEGIPNHEPRGRLP